MALADAAYYLTVTETRTDAPDAEKLEALLEQSESLANENWTGSDTNRAEILSAVYQEQAEWFERQGKKTQAFEACEKGEALIRSWPEEAGKPPKRAFSELKGKLLGAQEQKRKRRRDFFVYLATALLFLFTLQIKRYADWLYDDSYEPAVKAAAFGIMLALLWQMRDGSYRLLYSSLKDKLSRWGLSFLLAVAAIYNFEACLLEDFARDYINYFFPRAYLFAWVLSMGLVIASLLYAFVRVGCFQRETEDPSVK